MITDYATLQTEIARWLMRADLDGDIPGFIQLAEARFNRVVRARQMLRRSTALASDQFVELPDGWLKAKNIQRASDGEPLDFMTLDELDKYRRELTRGLRCAPNGPEAYALVGNSMELAPAPTAAAPVELEMTFYRHIEPLSAEVPTNWLLLEHPDVYLYGALLHSAPFLMDDPRLAVWQTAVDGAIAELNLSEAAARHSGAPLRRPITGFGG